jgi:hypothetical protein
MSSGLTKNNRGTTTGLVQVGIEPRLTYFMDVIEKLDADGIPGGLVECGIAPGGSSLCIASKLYTGRSFYGFDNCEMIPEPEPVDGERPNRRFEATMVDDYNYWEGCTKATDEFCLARSAVTLVPLSASAALLRRAA